MALLAFGKMARHLPDEETPITGRLELPGLERGFTATNEVAWSLEPGAAGIVTVMNTGPGNLYLCAEYEGVGSATEPEQNEHLEVHREIVSMDNTPLDPAELSQGTPFVVRIVVDTHNRLLDQMVVEVAAGGLGNQSESYGAAAGGLAEERDRSGSASRRDDRC